MTEKDLIKFLNSPIGDTRNFKWKEALWLPTWGIHVLPSEDVAHNIIETAHKMENIRSILGAPIFVTSWYRPNEYNIAIGGSKHSYHTQGLACDFIVKGYKPDVVRELLLDLIVRLDIRMEDMDGANWVHIDLGKVVNKRFFKP